MKTRLIKLSTDHYIIVDGSEIKEGDWIYNSEREPSILECVGKGSLRGWQKITHSTQPLESMNHGNYSSNVYLDIEKLSLQEVKELIGEVDVEKKAEKFIGCEYDDIEDSIYIIIDQIGYDSFIRGYNQALEDNKEKKYTEEDMRKAIDKARLYPFIKRGEIKFDRSVDDIIQSLQSKTEWEVEFIDNKLKLL